METVKVFAEKLSRVAESECPCADCLQPLIEADRAAVALSVLRELEALATTKKWVAAGEISKEAAWGRAYGEAMGELLAKYMQGGQSGNG